MLKRSPPARPGRRSTAAWLLPVLLLLVCGSGCVQRRMTINSNPPGTMVYIDNYEIGTTPVSTDYVYYGMREFRLVRDGYETMKVRRFVTPPWYEIFPLDFIAENVIPWEIRDERNYDFEMTPQLVVPTQQLLTRAEELRSTSQQQATVLPEGATPVMTAPPAMMIPPAGAAIPTQPAPMMAPPLGATGP